MLNAVWGAWQRFGRFMGDAVGRAVLTLFYFTILAPFALIMRLTQDPLRLSSRKAASYWTPRPAREAGLADSQKEY